jgi:hypothetical protein
MDHAQLRAEADEYFGGKNRVGDVDPIPFDHQAGLRASPGRRAKSEYPLLKTLAAGGASLGGS